MADFLHCVEFLQYTPAVLSLLPAPPSASCRLQIACRGRERVGLKVELLLKDPGENELGSDDWERRRASRATQRPVVLTGNHYSMRLGGGKGGEGTQLQIH